MVMMENIMRSFNKLPIHTQGAILLVVVWIVAFILLAITLASAVAGTELDQCIQTCVEKYPIVADKVFPDNLTFEDTSSAGEHEYLGTAVVLFPTKWENKVYSLTMNGEKAFHDVSYKGRPVFRFRKVGGEYNKPLKFLIETISGNFSYEIGAGIVVPPPVVNQFNKKETFPFYNVANGGRQAWRLKKKGPEFGKRLMVVFSDGTSFVVNNTSKNCRDREDTCNRDSRSPKYGFVFKPGIGPNGDGDDNTGTSHNGVYLHAPYGNKSKNATIHY